MARRNRTRNTNRNKSNNNKSVARRYETIDALKIHYRVHGQGPVALLLIHGAVGSINDFALQLADEDFSLSQQELTVVVLDLPGHGRSSKPDEVTCEPSMEFYELCCKAATGLMAKLGHKTYSVAGWSDGARVATLIAAKSGSSARVNSLVLWSFVPTMDKRYVDCLSKTRDIKTWNKQALEFYTEVYDESKFADMWRKYVDYCVSTLEMSSTLDLIELVANIKCPTLILYGSDDQFVSLSQHVEPLESRIPDSAVVELLGGANNLHQTNPKAFGSILQKFVVGNSGLA